MPRKLAYTSGRFFWDLYAPGWPSRAFDRHVERHLDRLVPVHGRPTALHAAIVAITRRCALRCEHCCEWDVLNRPESLSINDLHEIVRRLQEAGITVLFLSGGEPLQRLDAVLDISDCFASEIDVWMLSSGRGLTAESAARLRASGLTGIALSLDHWDPRVHDRFRGGLGAFAAAVRAASHARRAGLVVAVSLCPTRAFVSEPNLYRYAELAQTLGASFIQILEPKPVGHYAGQDVILTPEQQRVLERFARLVNYDPAAGKLPTVAYPESWTRILGCIGAGDRYLYVDTEGALQPCPFCRTRGVRVRDHDIDDAIATLRSDGCPAERNMRVHGPREHIDFPSARIPGRKP